jgi:hypothetical protein
MELSSGWHLAYCTNIHRGERWMEIFEGLQRFTLPVRDRVAPGRPYAIGLRLGVEAARDLSDPAVLLEFQRWLERHQCYVFTINGFPYGRFHGTRVKEQVYAPDWTTPERVAYTMQLFGLLTQLLPPGVEGSVSTVPGSFKGFIKSPEQEGAMRRNLWTCVEQLGSLTRRTGKVLHLGLEPEPLCYLETSTETVRFFEQMRADHPGDDRLDTHLGVNYDTCHLAVEFEEPGEAINRLLGNGVKLSKVHLSSALKVQPTAPVRAELKNFSEDTYLHQVVTRSRAGELTRFIDLDDALAQVGPEDEEGVEWRIHFHVPLGSRPGRLFDTTADHLLGALDVLAGAPGVCSHFEMETYTWEVLPPELKRRDVVDQLAEDYAWTLAQLNHRGISLR